MFIRPSCDKWTLQFHNLTNHERERRVGLLRERHEVTFKGYEKNAETHRPRHHRLSHRFLFLLLPPSETTTTPGAESAPETSALVFHFTSALTFPFQHAEHMRTSAAAITHKQHVTSWKCAKTGAPPWEKPIYTWPTDALAKSNTQMSLNALLFLNYFPIHVSMTNEMTLTFLMIMRQLSLKVPCCAHFHTRKRAALHH